MPSRDALMLPDVLTEGDNLEMPPMPDASFLFSQLEEDPTQQRKRRAGSRDINLQEDYTGSQFLQNSIENQSEEELALEPIDDIELGLDFGLDLDDFNPKVDRSIEIGRDAPTARAPEEDVLSEVDVQVPAKDNTEFIERDTSLNLGFGDDDGIRMMDDDGDVGMFNVDMGPEPDVSHLPSAPLIRPERISESPLSDIDDVLAAEVEAEHIRNLHSEIYEPEDETEETIIQRNPAQRARRQKIIQADGDISLTTAQIKEMQTNRDKILRPQSFLPRDPELLALMEMQKNGGFVSNIMNGGRSLGWAPELQGMLSLDAVRRTGELKRKRDSGIADMDSDDEQGPQKSPRLDLGEEDDDLVAVSGTAEFEPANTSVAPDGTMIDMAADDDFRINIEDDEHNPSAGLDPQSPAPNFDDTIAPLVHPADSGPVSLGTKHAVHLLRDRFGPEAANSPDKRKKASVLFQDLLPEATTSKADATKMFFEVLVLATKDAVKVEQQEALLGGPIRIRGKRGLWGDWAEREAGGALAEEEPGPSADLEQSAIVTVAA
jgi:cohesin complex subunit SCC1